MAQVHFHLFIIYFVHHCTNSLLSLRKSERKYCYLNTNLSTSPKLNNKNGVTNNNGSIQSTRSCTATKLRREVVSTVSKVKRVIRKWPRFVKEADEKVFFSFSL